jgi:SAM-dependent methyltransferase
MSDTNSYEATFYSVFEHMRRQGPGSPATTLSVLDRIKQLREPMSVLELGCGSGETALLLAAQTGAVVTAVDSHAPFIAQLKQAATKRGLKNIEARCGDMAALDDPPGRYDLLWAEGSAYLIGFEKALRLWRPLLGDGGFLYVSDLVWLTDTPSPPCLEYWQSAYPGAKTLAERQAQAIEIGFQVDDAFILPATDWESFYQDMEHQIAVVGEKAGADHPALVEMRREIDLYRQFGNEFGYGCLLLRKA